MVMIGVICLFFPSIIIKVNVFWIKLFFGKDLERMQYFNPQKKIVEIITLVEEDPEKFWKYYPNNLRILRITGFMALLFAVTSICVISV